MVIAVDDAEPTRPLKTIQFLVDSTPALSTDAVELARWMSERFGAPIGDCVKALLPAYVKNLDEPFYPKNISPAASKLIELNAGQAAAVARMDAMLDARGGVAMLFGVPASGKTEVYFRLIRRALGAGGQVMFLLPEIALTRPFFDSFSASIAAPVALWHSGLTARERRQTWNGVRRGEIQVVVGARSAALLPFKNLRLAVVDEEQDDSFKQDGQSPCYHARDVVIERGRRAGALVVLGSATPSLEAWSMAREGRAEFVELPERVFSSRAPTVRVVAFPDRGAVFSEELLSSLRECLARGEQSILLVNRRGFATLTVCRNCRWIDRCPDCGVAKIAHESEAGFTLTCHRCGKSWPPPQACGQCGAASMRMSGIGTQKVAAALAREIPQARIVRLDGDTAAKARAQAAAFDKFIARGADILVGTKLVAKGYHFPDVTLVGVIDADTMLNMPDFRAGEKTMQMLAQVAGRSGRAEKPGDVVLQTLSPDHDAIRGAVSGDYAAWADAELLARKELRYPPAAALVRVVLSGPDEARVEEAAQEIAKAATAALAQSVEVAGPAPALLRVVRGRHRHHVLFKLAEEKVSELAAAIASVRRPAGVRLSIDVDPHDMM